MEGPGDSVNEGVSLLSETLPCDGRPSGTEIDTMYFGEGHRNLEIKIGEDGCE